MIVLYNCIYNFLFIKTKIKPADVLIVFGTTYGIDKYVDGINNIVSKKLTKVVVLTGKDESKNIYNELLKKDAKILSKVDILLENDSTNTGENLAFSLNLLKQKFGNIKNIKSIIGLGKNFAGRRFVMTMNKYFPKRNIMFYPINVYNINKTNWFKNDVLYQKCLDELKKIPSYLKKGYIANFKTENKKSK